MARNKDLNIMTSEDEAICAWHNPPNEETAEKQSHGICDDCRDEQRLQWKTAQFERVPSYVERYKDTSRR